MFKIMRNTILLGLLSCVSREATAQISVECIIDPTGTPAVPVTAGTFRPIIIYCVNVGENSLLPPDFLTVDARFTDYFQRATFGNYNVQIAGILRQDATHAFVSNVPYDGTSFIVQAAFAIDIFQQADVIYNFSDYDYDDDGFVDFVMFTFLNYSGIRGTVGLPNNNIFTTNDPDPNHPGQFIKIDGRGYLTGSNKATSQRKDLRDLEKGVYDFIAGWFHELGHALFNFPDMDHGGSTNYNHYSIGGVEAMAGGAFNGIQSPFNPWFCEQRGWGSFTTVTSNMISTPMTDFYAGGTAYRFIPSLPPSAAPNQKFFVTYHRNDTGNEWTQNWPAHDIEGGLLIWHVAKQTVELHDASLYQDRRKMPIDIEAAHGKFNWTETASAVSNTGTPNSLTGFDSFEIRKISGNAEIQGPYFQKAHGSASVFFVPNSGKEYAFYTNPNSNFYHNSVTENYGHSVTSGIAIKNMIRTAGTTKIDLHLTN